jgi:hypothetical protein
MASNPPPPLPYTDADDDRARSLAPHRGGTVLTLGILGLVICFVCGIIAVVMGGSDLRAMREGRMDPSGEGSTKAGYVCGIVSLCLAAVGIVLFALGVVALPTSKSYVE